MDRDYKEVVYGMYRAGFIHKVFVGVITLVICVGLASAVGIPIINYSLDVSKIKSGTVVDKYATSSCIGGSSFYLVLQNDDANIRYPFFFSEDSRKNTHSVVVTEDAYDKVSVGESYDVGQTY